MTDAHGSPEFEATPENEGAEDFALTAEQLQRITDRMWEHGTIWWIDFDDPGTLTPKQLEVQTALRRSADEFVASGGDPELAKSYAEFSYLIENPTSSLMPLGTLASLSILEQMIPNPTPNTPN
jgi:hypothetical protein